MEKCVFIKASVQYFAFVVARKAQAIQEVPLPENLRN